MPWIRQADRRLQLRDRRPGDAFERKILTIRKQVLNSVGALARAARPNTHWREPYIPSFFEQRTTRLQGLACSPPQVGKASYEDLRKTR